MPLELNFTCALTSGLHARPAAHLADCCNPFGSTFLLTNLRNGLQANVKSALAIIAANVRARDACLISVAGADQEAGFAALRRLIEKELPLWDEPLIAATSSEAPPALPRPLKQAAAHCCRGRAVHRGIGQGKVVHIDRLVVPRGPSLELECEPVQERKRVQEALADVKSRIRNLLAFSGSAAQKGVIEAQLSIVGDVALAEKITERITQGSSAGQAVVEAGEHFLAVFQQSESMYIRERALDLQDVLHLLLEEMGGSKPAPAAAELKEHSVAVAETLSPQQLLSLDRTHLKAVVLQNASTTAHAVILARSLGIPTLVGAKDALRTLACGQEVVVDANRGLILPCTETGVPQFYAREAELRRKRHEALTHSVPCRAHTADGRKMEVAANVASPEELAPAFEHGADGIGLFRTEMLYFGRDSAPSEEEQFEIYSRAARLAGNRPVIIRTLDAGADKPIPHLNLPREGNPFLGYRGVRIYPDFLNLVRTQLRAILRASAYGRIQVMVPMISRLEEVLWFKDLLGQVQSELTAGGVAFDPAMPLGIMIEIPSVGFMLDHLCSQVDFFSIGTNDLAQYFFAAERGNENVAGLANVRHPAFLRFLHRIVQEVHRAGKRVGMCGDMAAEPLNLPLLVGMNLDEIGVPACEIAELKQRLRRLSASSCDDLLSKVIACRQVEAVESLLANFQLPGAEPPLLAPELVVISDDSENDETAIRKLVETLYLAGRTDDPQFIEEAICDREAISSTALGHGFAVPHCKTDAMTADSVGVLKLRQPIAWGSEDAERVRMVMLLAVRQSRAGKRHLQILSQLARKFMEEDFRARLLSLDDAGGIVSYLSNELGLEK